jgi:23S rRNA pseudouridine1911/1915/1917 synthase
MPKPKDQPVTEYSVPWPMRLDAFLTQQEGMKSRSAVQKIIDAGAVKVNGKKCEKPGWMLKGGEKVTVEGQSPADVDLGVKTDLKLKVLFEDDDCMVIEKPAGVAVHPGTGMAPDEATLLHALQPMFKKRKLPFSPAEVLVHRLDKDTTGCLLVAKNPKAHLRLQKQFQDRTVEKYYLTLVAGLPSPAAAIIDAPIGRHSTKRTTMSVLQHTGARQAQTTYRTLDAAAGAALLECELHTGRTHQIRVHLQSIGHPVLGDATYGSDRAANVAGELDIRFLCLHAWKLQFDDAKGKRVEVECPLPAQFSSLLKKLKIKIPR